MADRFPNLRWSYSFTVNGSTLSADRLTFKQAQAWLGEQVVQAVANSGQSRITIEVSGHVETLHKVRTAEDDIKDLERELGIGQNG